MLFCRVDFNVKLGELAGVSERQISSSGPAFNCDPLSAILSDAITQGQRRDHALDTADSN